MRKSHRRLGLALVAVLSAVLASATAASASNNSDYLYVPASAAGPMLTVSAPHLPGVGNDCAPLLGAPIPRTSIYAGKAIGNLALVLLVQLVSIPAALVVYNLEFARLILPLGGIALLAGIGVVAVGTLFGAMTTSTRASELLLPVLALPFFVPVVTAAAQATARLMSGRPGSEMIGWLKLLAAYDLVFVVACAFAYTVIADE